MGVVSVANFPKSSLITNDLYLIGIRSPDVSPTTELILAQSSLGGGGSGSGAGHILVNDSNVVFPQRARLKFSSDTFILIDDSPGDQTLFTLNKNGFLLKTDYDPNNDGIVNLIAGGTGLALTVGDTGFPGVNNGSPRFFKCRFGASVAPTGSDDSSLGYVVGSRWLQGATEYVCWDSTIGDAKWSLTTGTGSGSGGPTIQIGGISFPNRAFLNFTGSGIQLQDDPGNDTIIITLEQGDMAKSEYDVNYDGRIDINAGGTGLDLTTEESGVVFNQAGLGTYLLRHNFAATTDPDFSHSISQSYYPGSQWINLLTGELFYTHDTTDGDAVWTKVGKDIVFQDNGNVDKVYKPTVKFKNTPTNEITLTEEVDKLTIEIDSNVRPVEWVNNPINTIIALRDSMHGRTIKVSGSHQILCPSSSTAVLRDGFQVNILLTTDGGTVTYLPEDGTATVLGRATTQTEQWSMVNVSYELAEENFYLIGLLG